MTNRVNLETQELNEFYGLIHLKGSPFLEVVVGRGVSTFFKVRTLHCHLIKLLCFTSGIISSDLSVLNPSPVEGSII